MINANPLAMLLQAAGQQQSMQPTPDPVREGLIARLQEWFASRGAAPGPAMLPPVQAVRPSDNVQKPIYREVINSPFVQDTLVPLLGVQPRFSERLMHHLKNGEVDISAPNRVNLQGAAVIGDDRDAVRETVAHEMLHTADLLRLFKGKDTGSKIVTDFGNLEKRAYAFGNAMRLLSQGVAPEDVEDPVVASIIRQVTRILSEEKGK